MWIGEDTVRLMLNSSALLPGGYKRVDPTEIHHASGDPVIRAGSINSPIRGVQSVGTRCDVRTLCTVKVVLRITSETCYNSTSIQCLSTQPKTAKTAVLPWRRQEVMGDRCCDTWDSRPRLPNDKLPDCALPVRTCGAHAVTCMRPTGWIGGRTANDHCLKSAFPGEKVRGNQQITGRKEDRPTTWWLFSCR